MTLTTPPRHPNRSRASRQPVTSESARSPQDENVRPHISLKGIRIALVTSALLLLGFGLVMVFSSSAVLSFRQYGQSHVLASRQLMFAVIGVLIMVALAFIPIRTFRSLAWPAVIVSVLLLVLVQLIGVNVNGSKNWIDFFGPFRIQPSEFAKAALILWGAHVLTRKERVLSRTMHVLIPLVPMALMMMLLVLMSVELGATVILACITFALLYIAGARMRVLVLMGVASLGAVAGLTLMYPYRMLRITAWLDPEGDALNSSYQLMQGRYALGSGGWWGLGLGASREKWGGLPEAQTDFIFAVTGEELGLVGTVVVLLLLLTLIVSLFSVARVAQQSFVRYFAFGAGAWVAIQAIFNIGGLLGVLPLTGVTLPLFSYGGSSLIPLLATLGVVLAGIRSELKAEKGQKLTLPQGG